MEHWFDRTTKLLARDGVARREVLKTAALVGIASLLPKTSLAQAPPQTPLPLPQPIPPSGAVHVIEGKPAFRPGPRRPISETNGPCSISRDARQRTFNYAGEVSVDNTALRLTIQIQHQFARASVSAAPSLATTTVIEITYGSQSVVRTKHHFSPTKIERNAPVSGTTEIRCGSLVTGLSTASLTFQEGRVSGTVNGKTIAPAPIPRNNELQSLHFSDGSPVPVPSFEQRLQSAVRQLQTKAEAEVRTCLSGGMHRLAESIANFQNTPMMPGTASCNGCIQGCAVSYDICLVSACLLFCAGAPACLGEMYGCWASCFIPGSGCCGTPCAPFSCCDGNQSCCGSDVCCGPDQVCAMAEYGACCGKDAPVGCGDKTAVMCFPPGFVCCPNTTAFPPACPPNTVCQPNAPCCPSNQVCDGGCCPTGQSCQRTSTGAGVCCDKPLCGDVCCKSPATCQGGVCGVGVRCGNTFCGFGQSCINGSCCETCGATCCPPGQTCLDPQAGRCGEMKCFPIHIGKARFPCTSKTAAGVLTTICCEDKCCLGSCCPPDTMCCIPPGSGLPLGCYPGFQCIH